MKRWRNYVLCSQRDYKNENYLNLSGERSIILDGSRLLTKAKKIKVLIDYPLEEEFEFTLVSKKGFTKQVFYNELRKLYSKIYRSPNKYGIWGHSIGDLSLGSVSIRKDGTFYPNIGS